MMRSLFAILFAIVVLAVVTAQGIFDPRLKRGAPVAERPPSVLIAPLSQALTFARVGTGPQVRLIAVTGYRNGRITGVTYEELETAGITDPIALVNRLGYDGVRAAIERASSTVMVDAAQARIPVDLGREHIAVGTNYREHAEEAAVTGGPFLFPKYVAPTSSRAPIPAGNGLLDYEVELCLVTMQPLAPGAGAAGGLILCNDVTDRATLLRKVDPDNPQSGRGFTSGKSAPGFLPVGDLFVVPRDLSAFAERQVLILSLNGEERQRALVALWIWDLDRIVREAFDRRTARWDFNGQTVRLPIAEDGRIPERTLILTGTPAGTIFQGIYPSAYVRGLMSWLLKRTDPLLVDEVIEAHIRQARTYRDYLQPGDTVTIRVDHMGVLKNTVE